MASLANLPLVAAVTPAMIAGLLAFSHAVFHPAEASEQRLILYSPLPENDTAAKLARLLYRMLRYGEQYVDKGMNYYEEKYREHEIRSI